MEVERSTSEQKNREGSLKSPQLHQLPHFLTASLVHSLTHPNPHLHPHRTW
jgi:hypothetical protein